MEEEKRFSGAASPEVKMEESTPGNSASGNGEAANKVVLYREAPPISREPGSISRGCGCSSKRVERGGSKKEKLGQEKKLSRQERVELCRLFQGAVSSYNWELAESLITVADPPTLNDELCIALDSIWFLGTQQELEGVTGLIEKIISNGAHDFARAAMRTSFLASCVSACQQPSMSLVDTVAVMAQRLHDRLQECNVDDVLRAEAGLKAQKFTDWALKCIGLHSQSKRNRDRISRNLAVEIQLRLAAFKTFLDLTGDHLTGKDFTEAFDAACFPLTLFSNTFDPGWASGVSATAVHGLLSMLVERGADNVNQCFLEASRFGSTDLVRILLQIAKRNSLDIDVDLGLSFASHYGKIETMECLVEEGNATAFLGPLLRAAERGCLEVVQWFVEKGCRDMELCLALTAATASTHVEVAAFILPCIPHHIISALGVEIIKAAGERCGSSLEGVAFLLRTDFLGDPSATYSTADIIARLSDGESSSVDPKLRAFLQEHWSEAAFFDGLKQGEAHYVNFIRILNRGESPLHLLDIPAPLRVAIAYLPLYRECVKAGGHLLPQRLRGQLVDAVRRLGSSGSSTPCSSSLEEEATPWTELLAVLELHLPPFLVQVPSSSP